MHRSYKQLLQSHSLFKEPMNNIIASCSEIHQTNKNWNKPFLEQNNNKKRTECINPT